MSWQSQTMSHVSPTSDSAARFSKVTPATLRSTPAPPSSPQQLRDLADLILKVTFSDVGIMCLQVKPLRAHVPSLLMS